MPRSKTTSIARPAGAKPADAGRSRLGDLTRPIPIERRISRRPRFAIVAGLLAMTVIATIAVAVFVLPIGTWRDQSADIERRQLQLDELRRVNGELRTETERLETADGIREAAREDYGFVEQGEERASVLPLPPLSTDLPDGWPYSVVGEIVSAREAGPAVVTPDSTADGTDATGSTDANGDTTARTSGDTTAGTSGPAEG
ncbi:FtsB family cell division protein [Ilumatobacter sp.]|uniref:FtsB family cell division protein n=1 Tax=Ilumatobacter sp. TaxID=1967498 RepID=UPI003B5273F6